MLFFPREKAQKEPSVCAVATAEAFFSYINFSEIMKIIKFIVVAKIMVLLISLLVADLKAKIHIITLKYD